MRARSVAGIIIIAFILLFASLPLHALAATGDETTTGTISLVPTIECIGVTAGFTGDNNMNNSAVLEYRTSGGDWQTAPEMYADRTGSQYRGSIFWLSANTAYEVKVTFSDPNTVTGTNPISSSTTTRNDDPAIGTNYYYVATTGSDNNPGTINQPFGTIQKAADVVNPGDTVLVRGGTYSEAVNITRSGTADDYITFMPYPSEQVTLDGNGTIGNLIDINGADYIRIKGFTLINNAHVYEGGSIRLLYNADYCIIEDNTLINPRGEYGIGIRTGSSNALIQRNTILVNVEFPGSIQGIYWWSAGSAQVIRDNTISASTPWLWDGMGGGPEDELGYMDNSDIYGNTITFSSLTGVWDRDDGIQLEGSGVNVRIWGNKIENAFCGIGLAPVLEGPYYVFRNVIINSSSAMFKLGNNSYGRIYLYHNTYYTPYGDGYKVTNQGLGNIISKNNIVRAGRYVIEFTASTQDSAMDFNNDSLYTTDSGRFIEWVGMKYSTLAAFRNGEGQELNGISVADNKFVSPTSGNFYLKSNSPCVDKGVVLASFNDANSPWPYIGNAPDIGAYEYDPSAPTNNEPVLAHIGNKTVTEGKNLQLIISATDLDGDPLNYSASNLPTGASFNGVSRIFAWTPTSEQVGVYSGVHFEVTDGALIDFENITITVKTASSSGGSGGSGGGGGGGGGGGSGSTSLIDSMTGEGKIITEVIAESADQKVRLIIPKNTTVKSNNGENVNIIRMKQSTEQTILGWGARVISLYYDIQPSGTTFTPSATLVFEYEAVSLPENVLENNLYIALWDPASQEWTDLEGTVNTAVNTVSIDIQHLSTYALMAHVRPASFEVTDLSLTPKEVGPGEDVAASIIVSNKGDFNGTYEVELKLDNAIIQTKIVNLAGRASETVTFTMTSDVTGAHQVSVGGIQGVFLVTEPQFPPVSTVSELKINPISVNYGESVNISVLINNSSALTASYQVVLEIDDLVAQTKEITLDSGASDTISFDINPDSIGLHNISIGGLQGVFEVKPPFPPEVTGAYQLELNSFSAAPAYNEATKKLVFTKIVYQMNQTSENFPDAKLVLTVFRDGEYLEQVPLLALSQLQTDGKTGELSYIPSTGWKVGEYTFRAELYEGDSLFQVMTSQKVTVTLESITKIAEWWTLGEAVGVALILIIILVAVIIYRRRDMLKD